MCKPGSLKARVHVEEHFDCNFGFATWNAMIASNTGSAGIRPVIMGPQIVNTRVLDFGITPAG